MPVEEDVYMILVVDFEVPGSEEILKLFDDILLCSFELIERKVEAL